MKIFNRLWHWRDICCQLAVSVFSGWLIVRTKAKKESKNPLSWFFLEKILFSISFRRLPQRPQNKIKLDNFQSHSRWSCTIWQVNFFCEESFHLFFFSHRRQFCYYVDYVCAFDLCSESVTFHRNEAIIINRTKWQIKPLEVILFHNFRTICKITRRYDYRGKKKITKLLIVIL